MSGIEKTGTKIAGLQCPQAKQLFSPYLDGAVTGTEMLALQDHFSQCAACHSEYLALRRTQQLLVNVGRPKVPADLGLRLRLAISREAAYARGSRFEGLMVRLENAFNAFMVPAAAGFVSALILFGIAMVMVNTAPQLQPSTFGMSMDSINADSLVIEAYVDANGRVQDYRILSDSENSKEVLPKVKQMLIFTRFRPALSMGRPTPSRAVLSFSKVNVKG